MKEQKHQRPGAPRLACRVPGCTSAATPGKIPLRCGKHAGTVIQVYEDHDDGDEHQVRVVSSLALQIPADRK